MFRRVPRIRLRRDDHTGVLIGAGGERRADWLMTLAREPIDNSSARRAIDCTREDASGSYNCL